MVGNLLTTL